MGLSICSWVTHNRLAPVSASCGNSISTRLVRRIDVNDSDGEVGVASLFREKSTLHPDEVPPTPVVSKGGNRF